MILFSALNDRIIKLDLSHSKFRNIVIEILFICQHKSFDNAIAEKILKIQKVI